MAMHCNECGGIIPDVMISGDRNDCKNHIKFEEVRRKTWRKV